MTSALRAARTPTQHFVRTQRLVACLIVTSVSTKAMPPFYSAHSSASLKRLMPCLQPSVYIMKRFVRNVIIEYVRVYYVFYKGEPSCVMPYPWTDQLLCALSTGILHSQQRSQDPQLRIGVREIHYSIIVL